MSQVNVNSPGPGGPTVPPDSGDRTAAAGINFLTVIVVLAVVLAVLWFLFTGPLNSVFSGRRDVNVNVNTPTQQAPAPANPAPKVEVPAKP